MEAPDQALLEQARRGDAEAFARLFEPWRATLYSVACRLVGESDAEDVVMDTYLKAWRALPGFSGRSALRTWLYRIAHNCALDCLRARRHTVSENEGRERDDDGAARDWPDTKQRSPAEAVAGAEVTDLVGQAMAQLGDEHRTTLLLRFADELSYAEIAAATGVSIGTVMSRLFNGRRRLQRLLAELELTPGKGALP
jgi:RNA polymerase sigma-70 factor (ECF subfamily)